MNQQDFDACVQRIRSHNGVSEVIVCSNEGYVYFTTMGPEKTEALIGSLGQLESLSSALIRDIDPENSLTSFRIQTNKDEIIVSSELTHKLIVIHSPVFEE